MKTITENISSLEAIELRDCMEECLEQAIYDYYYRDNNKDLSWYKDCKMDEFFREWQGFSDGMGTTLGEGLSTFNYDFILNDETRPDFEEAFEEARNSAYENILKSICEDIESQADGIEIEAINIDDEVTDEEREDCPHCTDSEIIADKISEACSQLEKEGYKQFAVDNDNIIEFENRFLQDLYETAAHKLTVCDIAKFFGCQIMIAYQGSEPFDFEDVYFKKEED